MPAVLVDSNVILDIVTEDRTWFAWSSAALESAADGSILVINPIIYSEVSIGFESIEELDEGVPPEVFRRDPLPWDSAFLAGKAFLDYRRRKGSKNAPLPDFYIGAHAAVAGFQLLTRDASRYRTYFPRLSIIAPD